MPAWSEPFVGDRLDLSRRPLLDRIDRDWAWGASTGAGVTVAIIDSGIERGHPALGGRLRESYVVEPPSDPAMDPRVVPDPEGVDVVGHGTACAGIIHRLAPEADLVSIRVLGPENRCKGSVFAAGLAFAIERGYPVVNLSLSSRSEALFGHFHDLVDQAFFAGLLLVSAANNVAGASYPSLFSSVVSVAAHDLPDPWTYFHNSAPPVEFGACGLDVEIAWRDGSWIRGTGNSFAAPHIAGIAALIRAKHPAARPFELKALLASCASTPAGAARAPADGAGPAGAAAAREDPR